MILSVLFGKNMGIVVSLTQTPLRVTAPLILCITKRFTNQYLGLEVFV